ncbi:hypothetical protein ACQU0X_03540 [Pseudovibrio ascidiaceicola]|uniref:Uncharacterized protein n=1 Tax=Pseudovibrio ascidiaceicola TaxID=285279 RepID=A0A1I3VQG9_9HYPH|nr:hypothetical protein [Pseudovibrio ascidiaceicola]SFJ96556.1 hypothetical protein SAMN04488518_101498 [Pseudovibrio ascidiaceicola]
MTVGVLEFALSRAAGVRFMLSQVRPVLRKNLIKLIPLPSTTLILSFVLTYSGSWWTVHQCGVGWAGLPGEVTHHLAGSLKHPLKVFSAGTKRKLVTRWASTLAGV